MATHENPMRRWLTLAAVVGLLGLFGWRAWYGSPMEKGADAGKPAPAFTLPDLNGRPVSLAQFRGRPVLVNFWATWCPPCRTELPDLVRLAKDSPQCLAVVGVTSEKDTAAQVAKFAQDNGLVYPVLFDDDAVSAQYGVDTIPHSVLVDGEGRVVGTFRGGVTERGVRSALQELPPGRADC